MITIEQIRDAQDNDLSAISAVIEATEDRVIRLAAAAAKRMAPGGNRFAECRDEFAQVGRIAVWEALPTFKGDTLDSFFAYVHRTVETSLLGAVSDERYGGVSSVTMYLFSTMLAKAEGDPFKAEQLVQTDLPPRRRFSAARAYEARMAYQGSIPLDAPFSATGESLVGTIADVPADLTEADDWNRLDRQVTADRVHAVLDTMGDGQRAVLRHSFGIGGAEYFGYTKGQRDDEGLATQLNTTVRLMQTQRSKAALRFATKWVLDYADSDEEAAALTEAAARQREANK